MAINDWIDFGGSLAFIQFGEWGGTWVLFILLTARCVQA